MAYFYRKTSSDMTVILGAREQFVRQFSFGTDWTEIRIGMFWAPVSLSDNNAAGVSETVPVATVLDRFCWGIKDNSDTCPGQTGSLYLGLTPRSGAPSSVILNATHDIGDQSGGMGVGGYNGTSLIQPAGATAILFGVADPSPTTSYCQFSGLKFVVTNRGLSSQAVAISQSHTATASPVAGPYTAAALRTLLSSFPGETTPVSVAWNSGAAAYTLPDCWFFRNPFFNNRIRISCHDALKIAP